MEVATALRVALHYIGFVGLAEKKRIVGVYGRDGNGVEGKLSRMEERGVLRENVDIGGTGRVRFGGSGRRGEGILRGGV